MEDNIYQSGNLIDEEFFDLIAGGGEEIGDRPRFTDEKKY